MTIMSTGRESGAATGPKEHSADDGTFRCRWCRTVMPARQGRGRPRIFCSQACRQWDWVSRQRSAELHLGEHDMVVDRRDIDRLHDDLYALVCAVEDTERDLSGAEERTPEGLEEMIRWLLEAAKSVSTHRLSAGSASKRP